MLPRQVGGRGVFRAPGSPRFTLGSTTATIAQQRVGHESQGLRVAGWHSYRRTVAYQSRQGAAIDHHRRHAGGERFEQGQR